VFLCVCVFVCLCICLCECLYAARVVEEVNALNILHI
jgi:hypothetical protein